MENEFATFLAKAMKEVDIEKLAKKITKEIEKDVQTKTEMMVKWD